jgi:hypothetical protein
MVKVAIRVRQNVDGSFRVSYWWHAGFNIHVKYCQDLEAVSAFLDELVKKTAWKVFENVPNSVLN